MADRVVQLLNGVRRVGLDDLIALLAGGVDRMEQPIGVRELGDDAVEVRRQLAARDARARRAELRLHVAGKEPPDEALHGCAFDFASAGSPVAIVRISKIEMTGRNRMKRNMREKKRPSFPTKKDQSHTVGVYMPQEDGRKSR